MDEREREDLPAAGGAGNGAASDGGGTLEEMRRASEEFLAAGDEAIRRALSGDSESFLRACRQHGGE